MASNFEKKVGRALKELDIEYVAELSPAWAKDYHYDFTFVYRGSIYILEADGPHHFAGGGVIRMETKSMIRTIIKDLVKMKLALERGIKFIRIDFETKSYEAILGVICNALIAQKDIFVSDPDKYNYLDIDMIMNRKIYKNGYISKYSSNFTS